MNRRFRTVTYLLVGVMGMSSGAQSAQPLTNLVDQADLERAVALTLRREESQRASITALLRRDDVKSLAAGYRLDLRRAEAAVGTLSDDELQRVSAMAAAADTRLAGGDGAVGDVAGAVVGVLLVIALIAIVLCLTGAAVIKE